MNSQGFKHRMHQMLHDQHPNDHRAMTFNIAMATLILLNVVAVMLETVTPLYSQFKPLFTAFELFSVSLFVLEYLLRVWVADLTPHYTGSIAGRIRYLFSPMALIDLAAILPSLLFMSNMDLRLLRIARLFRVVRLLHIPHCNQAMHAIWQAARSKKAEFAIAAAIMLTMLIISSSLMYFAEHEAQPAAFSSIPAALWWGTMTLTTVGYGDVYPITSFGKVIASFFAALGIGFFALPSAILATALIEQSKLKSCATTCPHCGKDIQA